MTGFNDNKIALSDYNEANLQILRLHDLWNDCNRFSRNGNYDKWRFTLDRIWIELSADAEKRNWDKYYKQHQAFNALLRKNQKHKIKYYFLLNRVEEFLKKLQDDVGKGTKRSQMFEEIMI